MSDSHCSSNIWAQFAQGPVLCEHWAISNELQFLFCDVVEVVGLFTQPTPSVQTHLNHSIYCIYLFIYIRSITFHLVFKSCWVLLVNVRKRQIIHFDMTCFVNVNLMKHKSCIHFDISKADWSKVMMIYYILGLIKSCDLLVFYNKNCKA